ncbi:hypothetical protein RHMOL_Rhmol12G0194800 [Rhododendron molle]|uniref:Uncharacterized protein n=1 Tax=Rhododendron molle TaxID=49168 RepID=A0ACC0LLB1_RHOML|nr:hypothetical protein RHMOL_Rhmol12G0194800 [Rhododendron molle]
MQGAAFSFSPSLSLPKPRIPSASTPRFNPLPSPSPSRSLHFAPISSLRRQPSICSSSPRFNGWISTPPVAPAERESGAVEVLKVFPFPVTVTTVQFAVGSVLVLFMWTSNLYRRPKISGAQLLAILPLAMVHTLGNLFTNMSLGKVAVSFTHTIKAMEPFFSVVLSAMFLGEIPTPWVIASLIPIVGGVGLASMTEASFNWAGFWSAMASNLTNQSRNVLSKKFMVKKEESLDNITLFSIITIMSLFLLAPVTFFLEGVKITPSYLQAAGLDVRQVYTRSLLAALCFHAYQQVSYMILQRVSPVTHSVGNCVKRVVVIVTSVLFFRSPVSPINSLGTGVALAGVFLYSRVKRIKPKPKSA